MFVAVVDVIFVFGSWAHVVLVYCGDGFSSDHGGCCCFLLVFLNKVVCLVFLLLGGKVQIKVHLEPIVSTQYTVHSTQSSTTLFTTALVLHTFSGVIYDIHVSFLWKGVKEEESISPS